MLNIDEDRKDKFDLIDQILKSLHPWLSPEMYAKQKEREDLEEEAEENQSSTYEDELRSHGFSEKEIDELVKVNSKG